MPALAARLSRYLRPSCAPYGKIGRGPVRYPTGPRPLRTAVLALTALLALSAILAHSQQSRPAKVAVIIPAVPPAPPWLQGAPADTVARPRRKRAAILSCALALLAACPLAAGCADQQPRPLAGGELAEAQTFPYYRLYWTGPYFRSYRLTAADGRKSYSTAVGDSVFYGDCLSGKSSAIGESGCVLPLQVTTSIYHTAPTASLGPHTNALLRGVPAAIYDEGHSIVLYSGRLAIDVFSDSLPDALRAVERLRPINAPGSAGAPLPSPVYCPVLSGPQPLPLQHAMQHLPHRACQRAAAAVRRDLALFGKP